MPVSWTALFRVVVLLLVATHVFYMYCFARGHQEIVGLDPATILASSSVALVMIVPLAWAVALPDLPLIIRTQSRRRRWLQGRCADCGYFVLHAEGGRCPECGVSRDEPQSFLFTWATAKRFTALALTAWVIGCVAAEGWAVLDEASFVREAKGSLSSLDDGQYSRPRRWPMEQRTLYYTVADGITPYSTEFKLTP